MNKPTLMTPPPQQPIDRHIAFSCVVFALSLWPAQAAVNHAPQWNGTSSLTYNLTDRDGFDPKAYYYCKWGNYLDYNSVGVVDMTFNYLTVGPYNNANPDLFVTQTPPPLSRAFFPANTAWTSPNGPLVKGSVTFSIANNQVELYRYLHFRNNLTDAVTGLPIDATTKKIIVVFHGWNPNSKTNSFNNPEFSVLLGNLSFFLNGTDWKLIPYRWEADADTGPPPPSVDAAVNATRAAEISHQHGQHLAELLQSVTPNLERVHFIAHSAGSWAARTAMRNLLATNPTLRTELTLMDPFMPNAIVGINSSLGEPVMSLSDTLAGNDRIYLLENYFAVDIALGTQETFLWRGGDINLRVDLVNQASTVYTAHEGPVNWYADTLYAAAPGIQAPSSLNPFQLTQVGWQRSMFFQEPLILQSPIGTSVNASAPVTLSVSATSRFLQKNPQASSNLQFQWRKGGVTLPGATGPALPFANVRVSDSGDYVVVVSNAAGAVTSAVAHLAVIPDPLTIPSLSLNRPAGGLTSLQFNTLVNETYRFAGHH